MDPISAFVAMVGLAAFYYAGDAGRHAFVYFWNQDREPLKSLHSAEQEIEFSLPSVERKAEEMQELPENTSCDNNLLPTNPDIAAIQGAELIRPIVNYSTLNNGRVFDESELIKYGKNILIAGTQGSGKTVLAQKFCNLMPGHSIIVLDLDLHAQNEVISNWGNANIYSEPLEIFEAMKSILSAIESKDLTPAVIVCESWGNILNHDLNSGEFKGTAQKFVRAISTQFRKYNKLAIITLCSLSTKESGIEADYKEDYYQILLGGIAEKQMSRKSTAYPFLANFREFAHPTHGSYSEFNSTGNPPIGLEPVKSNNDPEALKSLVKQGRNACYTSFSPSGNTAFDSSSHRTALSEPVELESIELSNGAIESSRSAINFFGQSDLLNSLNLASEPIDLDDQSNQRKRYGKRNLDLETVIDAIENLNKIGCNQEEIIRAIWGVSKGNSSKYRAALAEYQTIVKGQG